jgi:hypothetical protein
MIQILVQVVIMEIVILKVNIKFLYYFLIYRLSRTHLCWWVNILVWISDGNWVICCQTSCAGWCCTVCRRLFCRQFYEFIIALELINNYCPRNFNCFVGRILTTSVEKRLCHELIHVCSYICFVFCFISVLFVHSIKMISLKTILMLFLAAVNHKTIAVRQKPQLMT